MLKILRYISADWSYIMWRLAARHILQIQGGPKKAYIFQHSISLGPFKIKNETISPKCSWSFREQRLGCSFYVKKGKVFPYWLPSVGPGADPSVQAVSPQVTWSESRHRPGSRLPLLSARPVVTSVAFTRWCYLQTAAHIWFQLTTHLSTQKGWVGLPVADGLPTSVVTHQLQVKRRTGKVRQSETHVLPLCHATNWFLCSC